MDTKEVDACKANKVLLANLQYCVCVCVFVYIHFEADGFWCWGAEVFLCPLLQWGQIIMQFLPHFFLAYIQTVPRDTWTKHNHKERQRICTQTSSEKLDAHPKCNTLLNLNEPFTNNCSVPPCCFFISWFKCSLLNNCELYNYRQENVCSTM